MYLVQEACKQLQIVCLGHAMICIVIASTMHIVPGTHSVKKWVVSILPTVGLELVTLVDIKLRREEAGVPGP